MIKIITDSTSYLPATFTAQRDIKVVPLNIHFGSGERFEETTGISNREFYRRLEIESVLPTTSQPSIGKFQTAFEEAKNDQILVITLSGKLSGTFNSAQTAANLMPDYSITVFDSRCIALGIGLMVAMASDMAQQGKSMADILHRLEQMRRDIRIFFTLDTLEYLHRGGRIGYASTMIGSLLSFKPILTMKAGMLHPLCKVRTRRRAEERILAELQIAVPNPDTPVYLGAMHVNNPEKAADLVAQTHKVYNNVPRVMIGEVGPALGVHGGLGILGMGICPVPSL